MTLSSAMRVSASGMSVERFRIDVTSANIANANSQKVGDQEPYRRQDVVISGTSNGPEIQQIVQDTTHPFTRKYEPDNPNKDADGYVEYSNVEPVNEMVDMMSASRAYEANIQAFNTAKGMMRSALNIGKV